MQKMFFSATALLLLSASYGAAAITGQDIATQYQSGGYQSIEVTVGPTQAKVEAIKDGVKIEAVYDLETGNVVKSESEAVGANEDLSSKVEMNTSDEDFTHESGDDNQADDAEDDNSGSSSGHDEGDDDGDSGSDHDGGDHGGGDGHDSGDD